MVINAVQFRRERRPTAHSFTTMMTKKTRHRCQPPTHQTCLPLIRSPMAKFLDAVSWERGARGSSDLDSQVPLAAFGFPHFPTYPTISSDRLVYNRALTALDDLRLEVYPAFKLDFLWSETRSVKAISAGERKFVRHRLQQKRSARPAPDL